MVSPKDGGAVCGFAKGNFEKRFREPWKKLREKEPHLSPNPKGHEGPYDPNEIQITELGLTVELPCGLTFDQLIAHEVAHTAGMTHISEDNTNIGIEGCF